MDNCQFDAPLYLILSGVILIGIGTVAPLLSIFTDRVFNTVEEAAKSLFEDVQRVDKNSG